MSLYLLNKQFQIVDIIEGYESFIWTERYDSHGDCVLQFSIKLKKASDFPKGFYLMIDGSDDLMIIRSALVTHDEDKGTVLEVRGKALTSLLDQRIVWNQTNLDSMLEPAVLRLLNENIIAATTTARRVPNLTFQYAGTTVPNIFAVEAQYQGETLYKAISDLCGSYDVGFRITHPTIGQFVFRLYGGVNRSYSQNAVSHVVFSPEYDNLENSSYFTSTDKYCNVVLVGGEGNGDKKVFRTINRGSASVSGVDRFEHYHSAQNASSNDGNIPAAKYRAFLDQQGREYLKDNDIEHVFEGETDPTMSSGYGSTYFLGDIVQISDNDTIESPARVVEYIRSDDASNGVQEFPALRIKD